MDPNNLRGLCEAYSAVYNDELRDELEEVDVYDIVISHLLDEGYADTYESAESIMVNMSEEWRDNIIDEARVDAGKTDDEKRTARSERGTVGDFMHPYFRNDKKIKGAKPLSSTGKYSQMQHDKKQAQRERDGDEQRRRDRSGGYEGGHSWGPNPDR